MFRDRSANILLSKLETMYALVSGYFSARPNSVIECFVVNDFRKMAVGAIGSTRDCKNCRTGRGHTLDIGSRGRKGSGLFV